MALGLTATAAGNRPGVLVAFDGRTGRRIFRFQTKSPASLRVVATSRGAVVVEERTCFSADRPARPGDTVLVGFDARTGHELWRRPDVVVANAHDQAVLPSGVVPTRTADGWGPWTGIDPQTGEARWTRDAEPEPIPAATGRLLLTTGAAGTGAELHAVDRQSGQIVWSYDSGPDLHLARIAADDDVVALAVTGPSVATFDQVAGVTTQLQILDGATGRLTRVIALDLDMDEKLHFSAIEVLGSTVVVDVGHLVAFDAASGSELWDAPGSIDAALPLTSGTLLATIHDGTDSSLVALDPHTGQPRWTYQLGEFNYGASATPSTVVVFRRGRYEALRVSDGKPIWRASAKDGSATPGMVSPSLYVTDGCPLTTAD